MAGPVGLGVCPVWAAAADGIGGCSAILAGRGIHLSGEREREGSGGARGEGRAEGKG